MQIADLVAVLSQVLIQFHFLSVRGKEEGGGSTYQDILTTCFWGIFDVKPDEELGQFAIEGFVHFVEDKIEEIEAGYERRWEIYVTGDGEVDVVF